MRWLCALFGILLLPVCVAATVSVFAPFMAPAPAGAAPLLPGAAWALLLGFLLWLFMYFALPRPLWSYVLAHELTHALWGWAMGAHVHGIGFSRHGGTARLSKTNVLITLAPYFCPFYTVMVIAAYGVSALFFNVRPYDLFWIGLVGFTWGFHISFTISSLRLEQPDLRIYGAFFSLVLIYLLNMVVLALLIVFVSQMTFAQWATAFGENLWQVLAWVTGWAGRLWNAHAP